MDLEASLAEEWHPTLNSPSTIESLNAVSKKVWWRGGCGHDYQCSVFERQRGTGCGYCAGKKVLHGFNDLSSQSPSVAAEWHPTFNAPVLPSDVMHKSSKKYWWLCSTCGHEWETKVVHRSNGSGCPACKKYGLVAGRTDLATTHPVIAKQLHPTKNDGLQATSITSGFGVVWWLGECGHSWEAKVSDRVHSGTGCHYCSGFKVLEGATDLASQNPEVASQWHPTLNGSLLPMQIAACSSKKVFWRCENCDHVWRTSVSTRTSGKGCPCCVGSVLVEGKNDLASVYPELAAQWHPTKNGNINPSQVFKKSGQKVWWLNPNCGHEWEASIANRANGSGCSVCSGKTVLEKTNDITSDARKNKIWHPTKNYPLQPSQVFRASNASYWWYEETCKHEWKATANGVRGCPICSGNQVLPGETDFSTTHSYLLKEWSTKNSISPDQITAGSNYRAVWSCGTHEWSAKVTDRTHYNTGCPECAAKNFTSKPEIELYHFLTGLGFAAEKANRKILGKNKELDLYIPERKFGIEFNGLYWHDENHKPQHYHYDKFFSARNAGIQLFQIWEDDWKDKKLIIMRALAHKLDSTSKLATLYPELETATSKIFARKTRLMSLSTEQARSFFQNNHVQGFAAGSYYLGLQDETMQICAVLAIRKEHNNTLNIVRYATSANVVGGFTKLLTYAERMYKPDAFVTFADHCVSDGGLYENNGFVADKFLPPDYMYVIKGKRKHKFGYRLKKFRDDPNLKYEEGLTERELASLNNLPRVWDAGKTRYVKRVPRIVVEN